MNHSTPGLHVHHQLLEFTQTHVHWVRDAIQSSHPLSSPSPPALNLFFSFFLFLNFYFYFILLYNTILVLPYIDMNPPRVYMRSQTWTPSYLPPHNIPLGHPRAPAPSMLYPASDIDWWFDSYMIVYMFQFLTFILTNECPEGTF